MGLEEGTLPVVVVVELPGLEVVLVEVVLATTGTVLGLAVVDILVVVVELMRATLEVTLGSSGMAV